jgi:hypothetical protein
MATKSYKVKYRVGNVHSMRTMQLQGGMESEAIAQLKKTHAVEAGADVIILSIEPS